MNNILYMATAILLIAGNLMVGNATTVTYGEMSSSSINLVLDDNPRDTICSGLGCEDGDRLCAEPSGKLKIGYMDTGLELDVKFYCYDQTPQNTTQN